jgi:hypothetical protein
MPQLKQDNALNEFSFTKEEWIHARILTPLQIAYLQTEYAKTFKLKASTIIPESGEFDRSFLLKLGEYEGELNTYQKLFLAHQTALGELNVMSTIAKVAEGSIHTDTTAARADSQVHKPS